MSPNYETLPKIPTPISYPLTLDTPHKSVNDDDNHIDQPTNKQARQLSPSQSTPEPHQPQSTTPNNEEINSPPNLTFDKKRQQQQDENQGNKKQKYQENADLPTTSIKFQLEIMKRIQECNLKMQ